MKKLKKETEFNSLSYPELFDNFRHFFELCDNSVVLLIAGLQIIRGKMTYGDVIVFQKYESKLNDDALIGIQGYKSSFNEMVENRRRFFEVYDYRPKIISIKDLKPADIQGKIEFSDMSFSYPLTPSVRILHYLSFTISTGNVVAIEAHSKSRKTTISNLIRNSMIQMKATSI